MASRLTQLTDYQPEQPEPALREFNASVGTKVDDFLNKLIGANGQDRYQLWPEKIVREALSVANNVKEHGTMHPGLRREDFTDKLAPDMPTQDSTALGKMLNVAPVAAGPQDKIIEQAQAMAALAGTGGLAGADATLGSTAFLRPALKYKDKLYKGKEGQQHLDVIPKDLYPEFERMAMNGEDLAHYNFGFMNHKGQFLDREKALKYAIDEGIVDAHAGQYGALTSTLMADSSKPGTAIEALAKTAKLEKAGEGRFYIKDAEGANPKRNMAIEAMGKTDIPDYLYHATYEPYYNNIKIEGLRGGKNKNYDDSANNKVYLSRDPENARSYAETSDIVPEEYLDKIKILKIVIKNLDKSKLKLDKNVIENGGDTLEYHGNIHPSAFGEK